ncbi:MAG TPA: flagellar basal body rod protein FlgB [Synergistaceae bacterium]|nr:flagellar basal body rod protein FlgB [Synergistaceae bacterium]HPJ26293.1 flagellar basal body rod protein FlgB [Synergistaceae bacterium]HPQ37004.1 flagellar basal body rod protein FlgB [Synergistaceae bacterium]
MRGDFTWKVITKDLEGLSRRFESVAENMSNGNTPRYARKQTSFEDQLRELVDGPSKLPLMVTHESHIPLRPLDVNDVEPETLRLYDEVYRLDGNNVDPEREEALMAQTRMVYEAMNTLMSRKSRGYKTVMGG